MVKKGESMIERWGLFELELTGPEGGNPFLDVELSARFEFDGRAFEPQGFYDGNGAYRIRFMPDAVGEWTYVTKSNQAELDGKKGSFTCVEPSPDNHGPVKVRNTYYLAYADGTPYFQIGTTCYAWAHQGDEMEEQTLKTLASAPFNKMRMCIFPKDYVYNKNEPVYYAFEGQPLKDWDFTRFNPEFWQHFEKRVMELQRLGIEADLILFHTYDRWGFEEMDAESDDRYIRYAVARLAAYRNVWWSLANEFDIMPAKKDEDWDRFFWIIRDHDLYQRMRGIHNCRKWYDHTQPWVIHASLQTSDMAGGIRYRRQYNKPVIYDECRYEGNIPQGWGNITALEMTMRFWLGALSGCYVGHGETYKHPEDLLWWAKGGVLRGQSPERISWFKEFMTSGPSFEELEPMGGDQGHYLLAMPGEYYLAYCANPSFTFELAGDQPYKIDGIDPWNMEIVPVGTAQPGEYALSSSGYIYRFTPYKPGEKIRPEAKASANVTQGSVPLEAKFSAAGDLDCHWDLGDGTTSDESNPTHVYEKFGQYLVKLTVTDEDGASSTTSLSISVLPEMPTDLDKYKEWPGSHSGLLFLWGGDNRIVDEAGKTIRVCEIEPRGDAKIGPAGEMLLDEGAFLAKDANDLLLEACKSTSQLTIEAIITTSSLDQDGPARIITFSRDTTHRNFTLGQERDNLRLRLRTPGTDSNGEPSANLAKLGAGTPIHVLVTYFPGNLNCYVNGELAHSSRHFQGDFSKWETGFLMFGAEAKGGRDWQGTLSGVTIYNRFMGAEEAALKYKLIMAK
jgi:PKD repeat protein